MPNKTKTVALSLAAIALLGTGVYLGSQFGNSSSNDEYGNHPNSKTAATPEEIALIKSIPKPQAPSEASASESAAPPPPINALAQLNDTNKPPLTDVLILEHLLAEVHSVFHALPTGDHDEVVAFLKGANPRQIAYFSEDNPNLNEDGEIVDRWGTPFFFHTLSKHRIQVRSAGPDHLHWSEDDIVTETLETQNL